MSLGANQSVGGAASRSFETASQGRQAKSHRPAPFSLRLSHEERAFLNERAGSLPLGAFIRQQILGEKAHKRRVLRKPKVDHQQLAQVLSALGESRLSSNLNQLAKHANMGTLEVSRDVEQELHDACIAVISMRDDLLNAIGRSS